MNFVINAEKNGVDNAKLFAATKAWLDINNVFYNEYDDWLEAVVNEFQLRSLAEFVKESTKEETDKTEKRMIFEIGKTYQHITGKRMTIIGRLKTHFWGECLIGETDNGELVPVGEQEDNRINWEEVEVDELIKKRHGRAIKKII